MKTQKSSLEKSHFPVMLSEIISIASPKKGGLFLDCTFGGGGYSSEILKFKKANVIAIDRDESVVSIAKNFEKKFLKRFKFCRLKFSQIDTIIKRARIL